MKSLLVVVLAFVVAGVVAVSQIVAQDEGETPVSSKEKLKGMARFMDRQARGFKAILEKDIETAEENFTEAGEVAAAEESWEGTLEAGYSLSSIGKTESARKLFDTAKSLTNKAKDWRSMLAVAYAYASLPEDEDAGEDAVELMAEAEEAAASQKNWRALLEIGTGFSQMKTAELAKSTYEKALVLLKEAEKSASDEGDWPALVDIGNGFAELKSAKLAKATYAKALHLLEKARDSEGLEQLARGYEEIGEEEKAEEVAALAEEVKKEEAASGKKVRRKRVHKDPPAGWSPTGKSLAEPDKISDESRRILAAKAEAKLADAGELALMDAEAQRDYSYRFRSYYLTSPNFGYRRWGGGGRFDVNGWAAGQFGRYEMVNGFYVLAD